MPRNRSLTSKHYPLDVAELAAENDADPDDARMSAVVAEMIAEELSEPSWTPRPPRRHRAPGRPPLEAGERMQGISAVVPATQAAWLRAQPGGISTTIRNAVAKAMMAAQKADTNVNADHDPVPPKGDFD